MIKIAIVDDNEQDIAKLEKSILSFFSDSELRCDIDKFSRGINFIEDYNDIYDCIFLDIDMPMLNGMECAHKIREKNKKVPIVFVTNYSSLAIDGYGVNALGFIVKPVKQTDVDSVMQKLVETIKSQMNDKKIMLKVKSGYQSVRESEIRYIEVDRHDIIYHCVNGDYLTRGVLKSIEEELSNPKFAKCSNCFLVNIDYVDSIMKDDVIVGDDVLKMSRNRKKEFIAEYLKNFN